jgi:hypothetical protein
MSKLDDTVKGLEAIWCNPRTPKEERSKAARAIVAHSGPARLLELVVQDPASSEADRQRAKEVLARAAANERKAKRHDMSKTPDGGVDLEKARKDLTKGDGNMSLAESRQLNALALRMGDGQPRVVSGVSPDGSAFSKVVN